MDGRWVELARGVLARRHDELDLTTGLVLGGQRALVIDTRGDDVQGAELVAAVRQVTALPLVVAITHAHFDHCFGTSAFSDAPEHATPPSGDEPRRTDTHHNRGVAVPPVFAQAGCPAAIRATADEQRAHWVGHYREAGGTPTADALAATDPVLPDHPVCPRPGDRHTLDLGDRPVVLIHPGPGHTDHDLAVHVPDARALFAGDLLESGAQPSYGPDAHPDRWPDAVAALLALRADVLVPGHGDPMTPAAAAAQHTELATVAELWRAVAAGDLTAAEADARSPHPHVPWPARRA